MPPQARLGDKALIPADAHGCVACPHTASGPAVAGSPNVNVNGRPAIRVDDPGIHTACCGGNTWNAQTGSKSVFINGKPAHRLGDVVRHCGGVGKCIEGSGNVIVGDELPGLARLSLHAERQSCSVLATSEATPSVLNERQPAASIGLLELAQSTNFSIKMAPHGGAVASLNSMDLGSLCGEAVLYGISKLIGGIAGFIAKKLGSKYYLLLKEIIQDITWVAFHAVPVHSEKTAAQYADWYFTNALDYLTDGGDIHEWSTCPITQAIAPIGTSGTLKIDGTGTPQDYDVTNNSVSIRLLNEFSPIVYQFDDELDPISIEELMEHAILKIDDVVAIDRMPIGTSNKDIAKEIAIKIENSSKKQPANLEIDKELAYGTIRVKNPTVYCRAIWNPGSPDFLKLHYVFMRSGSYLPTKELIPIAFEHAGDGESAYIILHKSADRDQYVLFGTQTGGHNNDPIACPDLQATSSSDRNPNIPIYVEENRPVIFIAHGSHCISPEPGKRRSKKLGAADFLVPVDWYPEAIPRNQLKYRLVYSSDESVRDIVFDHKVKMGGNDGHDPLTPLEKTSFHFA